MEKSLFSVSFSIINCINWLNCPFPLKKLVWAILVKIDEIWEIWILSNFPFWQCDPFYSGEIWDKFCFSSSRDISDTFSIFESIRSQWIHFSEIIFRFFLYLRCFFYDFCYYAVVFLVVLHLIGHKSFLNVECMMRWYISSVVTLKH